MDTLIGPEANGVAVGVVNICAVACEFAENVIAVAALELTTDELTATAVATAFESPLFAPVVPATASPDPSVVSMGEFSVRFSRVFIDWSDVPETLYVYTGHGGGEGGRGEEE